MYLGKILLQENVSFKFESENHEFIHISERFLPQMIGFVEDLASKIDMSYLLKSVMTDCIAFGHLSPKNDAKFSTKTLVCIAQSVISGYPEAECAGHLPRFNNQLNWINK